MFQAYFMNKHWVSAWVREPGWFGSHGRCALPKCIFQIFLQTSFKMFPKTILEVFLIFSKCRCYSLRSFRPGVFNCVNPFEIHFVALSHHHSDHHSHCIALPTFIFVFVFPQASDLTLGTLSLLATSKTTSTTAFFEHDFCVMSVALFWRRQPLF